MHNEEIISGYTLALTSLETDPSISNTERLSRLTTLLTMAITESKSLIAKGEESGKRLAQWVKVIATERQLYGILAGAVMLHGLAKRRLNRHEEAMEMMLKARQIAVDYSQTEYLGSIYANLCAFYLQDGDSEKGRFCLG